jgi:hypothetical protein
MTNQIDEFIARMRASGYSALAAHAEMLLNEMRADNPDDDAKFHAVAAMVALVLISGNNSLNGDSFDLATLCHATVIRVMRYIHENTEADGFVMMRTIGKALLETADLIEAEPEGNA